MDVFKLNNNTTSLLPLPGRSPPGTLTTRLVHPPRPGASRPADLLAKNVAPLLDPTGREGKHLGAVLWVPGLVLSSFVPFARRTTQVANELSPFNDVLPFCQGARRGLSLSRAPQRQPRVDLVLDPRVGLLSPSSLLRVAPRHGWPAVSLLGSLLLDSPSFRFFPFSACLPRSSSSFDASTPF